MDEKEKDPFESDECWCGMNHSYLDYDAEGNPFVTRDVEEDEE